MGAEAQEDSNTSMVNAGSNVKSFGIDFIYKSYRPSLPRLLQLLRQPLSHLREALVVGVDGDGVKQLGVVVDEVGAFDEVHIRVFAGGDDFAGDLAVGFEIGDGGLGAP